MRVVQKEKIDRRPRRGKHGAKLVGMQLVSLARELNRTEGKGLQRAVVVWSAK
jgi:hypothetical protein